MLTGFYVNAQTGNPDWAFPPNYWSISGGLTALPTGTASIQYPHVTNPIYSSSKFSSMIGSYEDTTGPQNMYVNSSGTPLFSIVKGILYNAHGYIIDTLADTITSINSVGSGISPGSSVTWQMAMGWSEVCVVPVPGSCKQYYVFTAADVSMGYYFCAGGGSGCGSSSNGSQGGYRPYFALIDLSDSTPGAPPGELGKNITSTLTYTSGGHFPGGGKLADLYAVTSATNTTRQCNLMGDISFACTRVIEGTYRLLFVSSGIDVTTYKITNSGIQFLYDYSYVNIGGGTFVGNNTHGLSLAESEVYEDSTANVVHLAVTGTGTGISTYSITGMVFLDVTMYGTGTGSVVATQSVALISGLKGIEFSPNGNYVYTTGANVIQVCNWSTTGVPTFSTVNTGTSSASDFRNSQIERGKDGNLYLIGQSGTSTPRLAKISNPNSPTTYTFSDNVASLTSYSYTLKKMQSPLTGGYYYQDTVFYMPDQIDNEIYGSHFTSNLSCCLFYSPYDKYTYKAGQATPTWTNTSSSQTWRANTSTVTATLKNPLALQTNTTHTVTIGEELRIPAGMTITIDSMTLEFSPQARLIIENGTSSLSGGKLILNNCTLTVVNNCGHNDLWPGIQVWGTPGSAQTGSPLPQGWLWAYNNTVIENAYVGVLAGYDSAWWASAITPNPGNPIPNPSHLSFDAGGTHPGGGGILQLESSKFLNNQHHIICYDYTQNSQNTSGHINLCTFKSTKLLTTSPQVTQRYFMGMYNHTNNFNMNGCTFVDTTSRSYADTGLYTSNSAYNVNYYWSGSGPYTRSSFSNFDYGVSSNNTGNSATVTLDSSNFINNKVGILLQNVNNATVLGDTFKVWNLSSGNASGLYLDDCTGYQVQGNYFTKGTGSSSNNRYGNVVYNSGAYINCIYSNTFTNLYKGSQAQYVNYVPTYSVGTQRNPAGLTYICNQFNSPITGADIYVPAENASSNVGATYTGSNDTAAIQYTQGTANILEYPQTGGNNFSHSGGGAYDFYIDSTNRAYHSEYIYYCTSGYCKSASVCPATYKNVLLSPVSYSVNCSTNAYTEGLRTSSSPLNNMLTQAAVYKLTYDSLSNVLSSLPNNSRDRNRLGIIMGNTLSSRHRLIDEAIHYLLNTHTDTALVHVYSLMKEKGLELPLRSQLETALNIKDSVWAVQSLNKIAFYEGQSNYVQVHTVLLQNLSKSPQQIMKDQSIVSLMQGIAKDSSDHTPYLLANILLSAVNLSNYHLLYQEDNNINDAERTESIISSVAPKSSLVNSPNPFNDNTIVQAVVVEKTQNAYIVITDMVGNEIARYPVQQGENNINVNAGGLNASVMFCTLVVDGMKIKTNKMVLIR